MKKTLLSAIIFGFVCAGFTGCQKEESPAAPPSESAATNMPATPSAPAPGASETTNALATTNAPPQ